jgi:ABC-type sugar transport system permease subunit
MTFYRSAIAVFAVVFIGLGLALLVVTAVNGGAVFGYLMGVLFVGLGAGRLYLLRPRS